MKAKQALDHAFIAENHKVINAVPLSLSTERLRQFNAASKLKSAQHSILASNRLKRSQLSVLNSLRTSQSKVHRSVSNTIKKIEAPVEEHDTKELESTVSKLEIEEKAHIQELDTKEDDLMADKRMLKTMQYIKDCVATSMGTMAKQEEKIEQLIVKYKEYKEAAKSTEEQIKLEMKIMTQMATDEEMKILEQIEKHNSDLEKHRQSYNEFIKFVSSSSNLLENKQKQHQKYLEDSILQVSPDSVKT